jgi:hypothetical protein
MVIVKLHLTNQTDKPLKINRIATDCGCIQTQHDSSTAAIGESLEIQIKLAASKREGKTRRKVKFHTDSDTRPLINCLIESNVISPVTLHKSRLEFSSSRKTQWMTGAKTKGVTIRECQSVRGVIRVINLTQDERVFRLEVEPLTEFGSASDYLRFYFNDGIQDSHIDVPVEIRSEQKARFVPSFVMIDWKKNQAFIKARVLCLPGHQRRVEKLNLKILPTGETDENILIKELSWSQTSAMLLEIKAR